MSDDAERAVLGAVLSGPAAYPAFMALEVKDFFSPKHQMVASSLRSLIVAGQTIDPMTVADHLASQGHLGVHDGVGGSTFLWDLLRWAPPSVTCEYHARMVRKSSRLRQAQTASRRFEALLESDEAATDLDLIVGAIRDDLEQLPKDLGGELDPPRSLRDMLAVKDSPEDWLIPGLLERGERVVITGGEGMGKSVLLKMLALCAAGGLNPWNGVRVSDGRRVLYVDAEYSERQNRKTYRWVERIIGRRLIQPGYQDRVFHLVKNEGLDLGGRDRAWMHDVCDQINPDLILVGPVYKLIVGDENDNEVIRALMRTLDEVRVKHDAAMVVEAHSPHGDGGKDDNRPVRPIGWSGWRRWPEIGFGLARDTDESIVQQPTPDHLRLVGWRGERDMRDWPRRIRRGRDGEFPWVPTDYWSPSVDLGYTVQDELSSGDGTMG